VLSHFLLDGSSFSCSSPKCRGVDCGSDRFPSVGSRTSASTFIRDKTCELSSDPPSILCADRPFPLPDTPVPSASSTKGPIFGPTAAETVAPVTIAVVDLMTKDTLMTNETAVPSFEATTANENTVSGVPSAAPTSGPSSS
jgi:hypothetical protein